VIDVPPLITMLVNASKLVSPGAAPALRAFTTLVNEVEETRAKFGSASAAPLVIGLWSVGNWPQPTSIVTVIGALMAFSSITAADVTAALNAAGALLWSKMRLMIIDRTERLAHEIIAPLPTGAHLPEGS